MTSVNTLASCDKYLRQITASTYRNLRVRVAAYTLARPGLIRSTQSNFHKELHHRNALSTPYKQAALVAPDVYRVLARNVCATVI